MCVQSRMHFRVMNVIFLNVFIFFLNFCLIFFKPFIFFVGGLVNAKHIRYCIDLPA